MPGKKIQTKGLLKKNITPFFVPVFCRSINIDTSFYKYIAGKNSYAGEYDWADASMVLLEPQGDEGNGAGTSVDLEVAYRLLLTLNNYNSVNIESTLSNQKSLDKTISKIAENHISRLYSTKASDYFELRSILKEIKELETLKHLPARKLTKKLRGQIDLRNDKVKNTILKQLTLLEKGTNNSILQPDIQDWQNVSSVMTAGYSRILSQHQNKYSINKTTSVHKPNILNTVLNNNPLIYEGILQSTVQNTSGFFTGKTYNQIHIRPLFQQHENRAFLYSRGQTSAEYKAYSYSNAENTISYNNEALTYNTSSRESSQYAPNILQLYGYKTGFISLIEKIAQAAGKVQTAGNLEKMGVNLLQLIKDEHKQRSYKDTVLRSVNERAEKFITVYRGIPEVRIPALTQTNMIQMLTKTAGLLSPTQSATYGFTENTAYGTSEYTKMVLKQGNEHEKRLSEEKLVNYIRREKAGTGKNVIFHSIMDRLGRFITVYASKAGNNLMLCEVKKTTEQQYMLTNTVNSTVLELKHNESVNLDSHTLFDKRVNKVLLKTLGNNVFQGITECFNKNVSVFKETTAVNFAGNKLQEGLKETFWRNFSKSTELVNTQKRTMFHSILEKLEGFKRPTALNSAGSLKTLVVQSQSLEQVYNEESPEVVLNTFSDTILWPVKFSRSNWQEERLVREIIEKRAFGFINNIYKDSSLVLQNILKRFNGSLLQHSTWSFYNNKNATRDNYTANNSELTFYKEGQDSEAINKIAKNSINETIIDKAVAKGNSRVKEYSTTALFERILHKNALCILRNLSSSLKSVRNFSKIKNSRQYLKAEKNTINLKESVLNAEIAYYRENTGNELLSQFKNIISGQGGSSLAMNRYITSFDSAQDRGSMAGKSLKTMESTISNVFEKNIFKEIINQKQFTEMIHNHGVKNEIEYSKGFTVGADIEHVKKASHKNNEQLELQEKTIKGITRKLEAQTELVKTLYEKQNIKTEKPVDIRDITNNVMRQLQKELRLERQRRGLE